MKAGKIIKSSLFLALGIGLLLAPVLVGAALGDEPKGPGTGPFGSVENFKEFVGGSVLSTIKWAFWVVAAAMIFYAAFVYLTAGGDGEKVNKASHMLLYAVIAMAVALLATILPGFVHSIVGGSGGGNGGPACEPPEVMCPSGFCAMDLSRC